MPFARMLDATTAWVDEKLRQFRLPPVDAANYLGVLKPILELATAADVLSRVDRHTHLSERWIAWCWKQLDHGHSLAELLRRRPDLVILAPAYPIFLSRGLRNPDFERLVHYSLQLRAVRQVEIAPWRKLEIGYAVSEFGIVPPWDTEECLNSCWLHCQPEPFVLCDSAAYSVTHTVFYQTRFGQRPTAVSVDHRAYLAQWLPVWAEYYESIQNLDIAGECILSLFCIGEAPLTRWNEVILQKQASDGHFSGPFPVSESLDPSAWTKGDASRREFLDSYHTTLVMLMVGALAECAYLGAHS